MYQFYFYVPEDHLQAVQKAVFAAGAGRIGDYSECCFIVSGHGQYRPLAGSHAFAGETGKLSRVAELKVEMVCPAELRADVLSALLEAHPYEEPAYGFIRLAVADD